MSNTSLGAYQVGGWNVGGSQYITQGTSTDMTYGTLVMTPKIASVIGVNPITTAMTYGTLVMTGKSVSLNRQKTYMVYQNDRLEVFEDNTLVWSWEA